MGVSEILTVLEKGDKLTSFEIAEQLDCSITAVKKGMKRLLKDISENVEFRRLTPEEKELKYGHKIGCRIHIYWLNE